MNEILLIATLLLTYSLVAVWYLIFGEKGLTAFYVVIVILANVEVNILVKAFGIEQTLGNVLFAGTFLITDILSELYGKKSANKAVNIGIFASITMILISQIWLFYIPAEGDYAMSSIITLFKGTPRIIASSLVVSFVCQKLDVFLYHAIWNFTTKRGKNKNKFLWLRNNGSTLTSQLFNAILFNICAFGGVFEWDVLLNVIISSYVIFIITALLDTPIIYLVRLIHTRRENKHNKNNNDTNEVMPNDKLQIEETTQTIDVDVAEEFVDTKDNIIETNIDDIN